MSEKAFPELTNDLIIKAAEGKPVSRVPVWVMRQAGRYLPEFMALRKEHDFFEICRTPALACQVTLLPMKRFDLDAAIIFSDILVMPQALGMEVQMVKGKGPFFPDPLVHPDDMKRLKTDVDVREELKYVYDAITLTRHTLNGKVPLIGFAGAPWTLMAYMIEGGGSKTYSKVKKWLYVHPEESHSLLQTITRLVCDHLIEQVKAGAQLLQVFDSHAGELGAKMFRQFCLPYLKLIADTVKSHSDVPMIIFAKGAHYALEELAQTKYDVIGLDWTIDVDRARHICAGKTLMGNLDPCALYSNSESLDLRVRDMVERFGTTRYIANLGHGIYPDAGVDQMKVFVDSVHKYSES